MAHENNLDDLLKSRKASRESNVPIGDKNVQVIQDSKSQVAMPDTNIKKLGIFDKMKLNKLESEKELEAQRIIRDTHLSTLTHQSEAKIRESQAFWDAKSVEVAESIKTYVQSKIRDLENERLTNRIDAITECYERANKKIQEVWEGNLPRELKDELINRLLDSMKETVERITSDAIAEKYNLK